MTTAKCGNKYKGKFQPKPGMNHVNLNAKTMCKLDHLKSIAEWAATEASIHSLGAFFRQRLDAMTDALGIHNYPSSLFMCERCGSVLQPGDNCMVRIENRSERRHIQKKSNLTTQNHVVYTCHFCSHRNMRRGTPRGYVNDICPPKAKLPTQSTRRKSVVDDHNRLPKLTHISEVSRMNSVASPTAVGQNLGIIMPATPVPTTVPFLLDPKMKRRNRSSAKKVTEVCSIVSEGEKCVQTSNKRRRKTWTSLKEIAESSEHDTVKKFSKITIPFII